MTKQSFSTELQCNAKLTALALYQDMDVIYFLDNLYLHYIFKIHKNKGF